VNTGFRAPTPQQVKLGTVELALTGVYRDPVLCADINAPLDATQCARNSLPYRQGGNPDLKPETSEQGTLGVVFLPTRDLKVSADYWEVRMEDRIRSLSPATMITNYGLFADNFIRDANGRVVYIQAGWVNASRSVSKGVDFSVDYSTALAGGRLTTKLSGTHMISHKEALLANAPLVEFVGEWSNTTLYLPWKLSATVGFKRGDWNTTATINYADKYLDEDRSAYTVNPGARREVAAYTTVNLFTTYTGLVKGLRLTAGFINLFDAKPPFTHHNVDNVVGAGWDPRVADPRGRTFQLTARYDF
jgi:iron complex outermembrane recepter protein